MHGKNQWANEYIMLSHVIVVFVNAIHYLAVGVFSMDHLFSNVGDNPFTYLTNTTNEGKREINTSCVL